MLMLQGNNLNERFDQVVGQEQSPYVDLIQVGRVRIAKEMMNRKNTDTRSSVTHYVL